MLLKPWLRGAVLFDNGLLAFISTPQRVQTWNRTFLYKIIFCYSLSWWTSRVTPARQPLMQTPPCLSVVERLSYEVSVLQRQCLITWEWLWPDFNGFVKFWSSCSSTPQAQCTHTHTSQRWKRFCHLSGELDSVPIDYSDSLIGPCPGEAAQTDTLLVF